MADGHDFGGGHAGGDTGGFHDPGHGHSDIGGGHHHDHHGDHHDHHHHHGHDRTPNGPGHHHSSDPYGGLFLGGQQSPESSRQWRQDRENSDDGDDGDAEQQPLLTRRNRRTSPAPIMAVATLIVIIGAMAIIVVSSKSGDGYTGSAGPFE